MSTPAMKKQNQPKYAIKRYISRREALEAYRRLNDAPAEYVLRFPLGLRAEHFLLIISFTMLALTGLSQTYYQTAIGDFILGLFGGIDAIRQVHHAFAFLLGAQSIYHVGLFIYKLVVYRQISGIWPEISDLVHLLQVLRLNLGITKAFPFFGRYTFEEKVEYWALVWGTIVMGVSGVMQWFPVQVTKILPGWAIPVAQTLHRLEAILAVLAISIWHTYHTVLKSRNTSIFTGYMSIEEMENEHPLELAYLKSASKAAGSKTWPVLIEIPTRLHRSSVQEQSLERSETEQPKETGDV